MPAVADVMSTGLITVQPSATVAEAATVMGKGHVGSVLVFEGDELVGIFTERDVVKAFSQDFAAPSTTVEQWMTRNPMTIDPDASVPDALNRMLERGFRHLPVVAEGRVVGMVSMRDLSAATSE